MHLRDRCFGQTLHRASGEQFAGVTVPAADSKQWQGLGTSIRYGPLPSLIGCKGDSRREGVVQTMSPGAGKGDCLLAAAVPDSLHVLADMAAPVRLPGNRGRSCVPAIQGKHRVGVWVCLLTPSEFVTIEHQLHWGCAVCCRKGSDCSWRAGDYVFWQATCALSPHATLQYSLPACLTTVDVHSSQLG